MPDLIAQGPDRSHRWRRRLPERGQPVLLGRDTTWRVDWDRCISRKHAKLRWLRGKLQVELHATASNPIFFGGRTNDRFQVRVGQHFVIGETSFTVVEHAANVSLQMPLPVDQQTFTAAALGKASFRHAHHQIHALSRLPEIVAAATSDEELYARLIDLILSGFGAARAAAVVRHERRRREPDKHSGVSDSAPPSDDELTVLHWDRIDQDRSEFQPSGPLIRQAITTGENVIHYWQKAAESDQTVADEFDWALCSPIPGVRGGGEAIYVAGHAAPQARNDIIQDGLKFVQLVASTAGSIRSVRQLQQQATVLSQFFSAPVREAVAMADPEVALAPRETQVTVMFCDLRGFSRRSEESSDDLFGLLERVSHALGIMTGQILDHGGVIGDFHGDAAMGFWGWPMSTPDEAQAASAVAGCRAALQIQAAFEDAGRDQGAMSGFRVGVGLATGAAVAGKIGTVDQVKVTAFGPVVNFAARLEGMTRFFELEILIDERTARLARAELGPEEAIIRELVTVRPYGMDAPRRVFQLAPLRQDRPQLLGDAFEAARTAFETGNWERTVQLCRGFAATDRVCQFFLNYISNRNEQPPADWPGWIDLKSK